MIQGAIGGSPLAEAIATSAAVRILPVPRRGLASLMAGVAKRLFQAELAAVPGLGKDKARTIARYVSFGTKIEIEPGPDDIASPGPSETKTPAHPSDKLTEGDPRLDINRADVFDLTRIPGVGKKTAERIIDCREKNGPFRAVADLEKVEGIGKKKAERIGEYVTF